MSEELYNEFKSDHTTIIKQYLITGKLYEEYTDLSTYGVRIEKISIKYGGIKSRITNEMQGIFCRLNDAEDFMEYIYEHRTAPEQLHDDMNKFIDSKYLSRVTA